MVLYKHISNTDVAATFLSKTYSTDMRAFIVKLIWFNIVNPKNIFKIENDTVVIDSNDFKNWKLYEQID